MVLALVGAKWLPSVTHLQLLWFGAMLYPLHALNLNMLMVKCRSDLFLQLENIKKIIAVPIMFIGIYFGIEMMIISMVISSFIAYFINSYWSGRLIDYPMKEQIIDILPSFFVALFMPALLFIFGEQMQLSPAVELILQLFLGAAIVLLISRQLKMESYLEIKELITQRLRP